MQAADPLPPPRVAVVFMYSVSHSRIYRDKSGGESWCRRHESCLYQLRALRFTQIFRQVPAAGRAPRHRKLPARTSCERSRGTGAPRARAQDAHRISHRAPRSAPIAARPAQPRRRARSAGASPQFRERAGAPHRTMPLCSGVCVPSLRSAHGTTASSL